MVALALWGWTSSGCALNPVTGAPEISFMSLEEELEIGKEVSKQLEERYGLWQDEALVGYVQEIGARLAARSPRQEIEYRFNVLDDEFPNALALPGGYVYVSRGLLALVNSEDELANVIGHEIGHVAARHASSQSWRSTAVGILSTIGSLALGPLSGMAGQGILASHSRGQESQADEIGQQLAHESGWRAQAMSDFLRALDRDETIRENAVREASFLDSHPVTVERIETTRDRALSLGEADRPSELLQREAFLERLRGLPIGQDPRGGVFIDDNVFVHRDLDFRIRFPEGWVTINAETFVGASDGPVRVRLELHEGDEKEDGKQAAREYLAAERRKRDEAAEKGEKLPEELVRTKAGPRRIGRKRVGYAIEGTFQRGAGTAIIYFVALPDRMYRVTCLMATQLRGSYEDDCRRTVSSLRPTRLKEREQIRQVTLQLAQAGPEETLRQLVDRTGSFWDVAQTAAANGLSLPYDLEEGQLVKYAQNVAYTPAPQAEDPVKAADEDGLDEEDDDEDAGD